MKAIDFQLRSASDLFRISLRQQQTGAMLDARTAASKGHYRDMLSFSTNLFPRSGLGIDSTDADSLSIAHNIVKRSNIVQHAQQ